MLQAAQTTAALESEESGFARASDLHLGAESTPSTFWKVQEIAAMG